MALGRTLLVSIERVAMVAAGVSMLAVMAVVVLDVLMRYGFNAPFTWSHDLISYYLIAGLFFPALAHATRNGQHVRVDLVYILMPRRLQRACDLLVGLAMAALVCLMIVLLFERMSDELAKDLVIAGFIEWPLWAMTAIPLLGMTAFLARLLADAVANAAALLRGTPSGGDGGSAAAGEGAP
mgnify:FL=1